MQAIICEICGSNSIVKQDGYFVCQHCGTKYTVEEARKLLGTVKIDKTEEIENLLILARRARESNNIANAERYYSLLLREEPYNWEAAYFQVYYQALGSSVVNLLSSISLVANNLDNSIKMVSEIQDEADKENALKTIVNYTSTICELFTAAAIKHYQQNSRIDGSLKVCNEQVRSVYSILTSLETSVKKYFCNYGHYLSKVQNNEYKYLTVYDRYFTGQFIADENRRLPVAITRAHTSNNNTSGCYIATAVYGSYDCPEVWTLRRFRDDVLSKTILGRVFIRLYYSISPVLVRKFGSSEWFKKALKPNLDRIVYRLNNKGLLNTPYSDQ